MRDSRFRWTLATASAGSALLLLLSGCSSASDDQAEERGPQAQDQEALEYATQQIDAAKGIPEFSLNAEAFDMSGIAGKTIFNIPTSTEVPSVVAMDSVSKELAESYGATWTDYQSTGSPDDWAQGVDQAIAQSADLIILSHGMDPSLMKAPMQRAKEAGIPILAADDYAVGVEAPSDIADLIAGYANTPFAEAGRLLANAGIVAGDGASTILLITVDEVPPSAVMTDAFSEEITENCPDCEVTSRNVPVVDWATKIASTVQSELQSNPNIDVVIPLFDSMSIYVQSGLNSAGAQNVAIASFNGTPDIFKMMQDGSSIAFNVGESYPWMGYNTLDQAGRILTDAPLVEGGDYAMPLRVFDDSNISEVGTPPDAAKGYGDAFIKGYESLWAG